MVIDSLNSTSQYEHINPLFKKAFDYLKTTDFEKAEVGKIELEGKDLFVMVSDSNMKTRDAAKLEVHDAYIDIQMPVSKAETFGWMGRSDLKQASAPFNEEKDIQFFDDKANTFLTVEPKSIAIFFPEDGHAPCIGEGVIRKVVVKVKVQVQGEAE